MHESVFVTGATGVIGRRVVPELVKLGYGVTAIGRSEQKREFLSRLGATAVASPADDNGRVSRAKAAKQLAGHAAAINLATHMPPSLTRMMLPWEWRENDRVRRDDSAAFVDAAIDAGVSRFIQESFAPLYEDAGDRWIDETCPMRPAWYNRTVLDAEDSAHRFTGAGGAGVVVRFAGFYGPDAVLDEMLGVVRKGWSPMPGRADAYWSSVSHDDAAMAVVAALHGKIDAGTYNICDDEPLQRAEWIRALATADHLPMPKLMPTWLTGLGGSGVRLLSRSQRMSNGKFKNATGWTPRWRDARAGLADAVRVLRSGALSS
jgi:nucleoside-diphosphate-sugar epimerase